MPDIRHIKPTTYAELVAQAEAIYTPEHVAKGNAETAAVHSSAFGPPAKRDDLIRFHVALGMTPAIKAEQEAARRAYYRSQGFE